ncbi:NmrA-like family protein [Fonsecaea pedrosoi]|nr:NmrA-like family protein [Fonsecaea pedrosoi]
MITVAVAGATGGVGRSILDHVEQSHKFRVIVLTRKASEASVSEAGTRYLHVDYDDVEGLADILTTHNVHTVVSTIGISSPDTSAAQCNLIRAADKSGATKRLIPSEFWAKTVPDLLPLDPTVQWWLDAASLLESSSLQYTRISCGWFMDYWGMPHVKTHLSDYSWAIDVFNRKAGIPGDGANVLSLTLIGDVARAILLLLEAEDWPEWTFAVGDSVTFHEFVSIAERVRGGAPFEITHDTLDDLNQGKVTILPNPGSAAWDASPSETAARKESLILFGKLYVSGVWDLSKEPQFSTRCPEWRPKKLGQFLEEVWLGRP